jgi:monoterpene epsilon-lactone hydrolase
MQSWQTDLLNLYLRTSVKPLLRRARSLKNARAVVRVVDQTLGRLSIPRHTRIESAQASSVNCRCDWIDPPLVGQGSDRARDHSRVILYLPGGAYIVRTPNAHSAMISRLCSQADARALVCYYRLAPENPFPACLEDSVAAYEWLLKQGYRPEQIVVAGDSAGGGLALSTLLALRDAKRPLPACAVMMSPLLDSGEMAPSRAKNARSDAVLPPAAGRGINPRPMFLGGHDPKNPLVSPIYGEYQGLPPMYVMVSDSEMLMDDSLRLARRAQLYKVEVRVDIWRKAPHVWPAMPFLPESRDSLERAGRFIVRHVAMPVATHQPKSRGRRKPAVPAPAAAGRTS